MCQNSAPECTVHGLDAQEQSMDQDHGQSMEQVHGWSTGPWSRFMGDPWTHSSCFV